MGVLAYFYSCIFMLVCQMANSYTTKFCSDWSISLAKQAHLLKFVVPWMIVRKTEGFLYFFSVKLQINLKETLIQLVIKNKVSNNMNNNRIFIHLAFLNSHIQTNLTYIPHISSICTISIIKRSKLLMVKIWRLQIKVMKVLDDSIQKVYIDFYSYTIQTKTFLRVNHFTKKIINFFFRKSGLPLNINIRIMVVWEK